MPDTTTEKPTDQTQTTTETPENEELLLDDLFGEDEPQEKQTAPKKKEEAPRKTDNETVDDDVEKRVLSQVDKRLSSTMQQFTQSVRKQEVSVYLGSDAGKPYASYAESIVKVATDPRFSSLSMERVIGLALAPATLLKIGAKMAKEADTQARATTTGGGSATTQVSEEMSDVWGMDAKKFEEMKIQAKRGVFKTK